MRILLEGPDCAGKTTLLEGFSKTYSHHNSYTPGTKDQYLTKIDSFHKFIKDFPSIVVDRHIFSEIVYGNNYHGESRISSIFDERVKWVLDYFDVIIFCLPQPKWWYLERFKDITSKREEMITDVEMMGKIYDAFENLYDSLRTAYPEYAHKFITYDYLNIGRTSSGS